MPNIGPPELIIILVIALIVIGPGRLPDVGAALGKSIREFRKASSELSDATRVDPSPAPPVQGGVQPAPNAQPAPNTLSGETQPNTLSAAPPAAPVVPPPPGDENRGAPPPA